MFKEPDHTAHLFWMLHIQIEFTVYGFLNIFHSLIENNLDSNNSTFSTSMNFHELLYLKYSNTLNKNQPDTEIPNQAVFFHLPTTANEMLCAIFASSLLI